VASRRDTNAAVTIEARTISRNLANAAERAARARPAAIEIRFRAIHLLVEALRVAALVLRTRNIADTIARLVTSLPHFTNGALSAATVDVRLGVVEFVVRTGAYVTAPVSTRRACNTIGVLQTIGAGLAGWAGVASTIRGGLCSVLLAVSTGRSVTQLTDTPVTVAAIIVRRTGLAA